MWTYTSPDFSRTLRNRPRPGGEGAKHWMALLAELRNRGVQGVCIAACDGLKGLPEAIGEIWPQATVQRRPGPEATAAVTGPHLTGLRRAGAPRP